MGSDQRTVKLIAEGIKKRLGRRNNTVLWIGIAGIGTVIYVCHRGGLGCRGGEERN